MLKLYTYYRSSAAYRVRIALNLKGLEHDLQAVHLARDGGEHKKADYLAKNPMGLVPLLEADGNHIAQSLAIIEYLDETYPEPALLPGTPLQRARVRSLAQSIACDIHPLNNLRVLKYLSNELAVSDEQKAAWYQNWVAAGFNAIEQSLSGSSDTGRFCHGDNPTLADCCLVPQVYNAERFNCPMEAYPAINRIVRHCRALDAFIKADPANQPDAE